MQGKSQKEVWGSGWGSIGAESHEKRYSRKLPCAEPHVQLKPGNEDKRILLALEKHVGSVPLVRDT
jgi:hypothetical protein